jgi:hypothetical protein
VGAGLDFQFRFKHYFFVAVGANLVGVLEIKFTHILGFL